MFAEILTRFAGLEHWQVGLTAVGLLWMGAVASPFPEEVIIISLGILCGRGRISFGEALFYNCLGLVPSNLFPVVLGRYFGARLLRRRPFRWMADPASVDEALIHLRGRSGDWIVFITRFTPFVRGPVYFAVGLAGMAFARFLWVDTVAAVIQVALIQLAGRKLGEDADSLVSAYQKVGILMAALLVGGAVWGILRKRRAVRAL